VSDTFEIRITPEPSEDHRRAILGSVQALLQREASLARPSSWRVADWVAQRSGIRDLATSLPDVRRWPLSARLPWGGREFPGLNGRGDAK